MTPGPDTDLAADLTLVIPAAGRSSRMRGADKLMEEVDGVPLLARVVARAVQVAPTRVVVAQGQEARAAAVGGSGAEIVTVEPGGGMGASLAAGVAGLKGAAMIVLADMPDVTAHDLARLVALWRAGAGPILRAADVDGTPGHPVILPPARLREVAALSGDRGAGGILAAHARDVVLLPIGPGAVTDLDTPEDWARWRARR